MPYTRPANFSGMSNDISTLQQQHIDISATTPVRFSVYMNGTASSAVISHDLGRKIIAAYIHEPDGINVSELIVRQITDSTGSIDMNKCEVLSTTPLLGTVILL